jgi:hypothetical protein
VGSPVVLALDAGVTSQVASAKGPLDMRLSNLRIMLTGLGTLLAVIAQFYPPGRYPHNL